MATIGYLRVSTDRQDLANQRLELLDWANREGTRIDEWVEREMSSRRSAAERGVEGLVARLGEGDTLVVAELSRLGRSLGEVVQTVDRLAAAGVRLVVLKGGISVGRERGLGDKILVGLFALLAEVERDLLSQRTRAGLARARAQGKRLGRPKGSLGVSKLDGREAEIRELLLKGVSLSSLARIVECAVPTLAGFVDSRGLRGAYNEGRARRKTGGGGGK
ncbi:MAG: recombinase family protein [Desulfovibrionaceae bacterium]